MNWSVCEQLTFDASSEEAENRVKSTTLSPRTLVITLFPHHISGCVYVSSHAETGVQSRQESPMFSRNPIEVLDPQGTGDTWEQTG